MSDIRFTEDHEWILLEGDIATVGVTDYRDPFDARVENGRLYGRGSCDMKAALAAFVEVARAIGAGGADFAGELIVAGIADEEDRMIGSVHWSEHRAAPDFAIVGEPTSLKVCPGGGAPIPPALHRRVVDELGGVLPQHGEGQ